MYTVTSTEPPPIAKRSFILSFNFFFPRSASSIFLSLPPPPFTAAAVLEKVCYPRPFREATLAFLHILHCALQQQASTEASPYFFFFLAYTSRYLTILFISFLDFLRFISLLRSYCLSLRGFLSIRITDNDMATWPHEAGIFSICSMNYSLEIFTFLFIPHNGLKTGNMK